MFNFGNTNSAQRNAIETTEGPVLIIAGPGTGKTFTLVQRAVYLIEEKQVAPENIMIATFTEKAAKELITRLSNVLLDKNINVNVNDMYIGTLHSICLRIIKEHLEYTHLRKDYRMVDDFEQKYLVYQHSKMFREVKNGDLVYGDSKSNWVLADTVCYYANAIGEELVEVDDLVKQHNTELNVVAEIVGLYHKLLEDENALDFSSIQRVAYNMLKDHAEVRDALQDKIRYIMIDEYQDTNYVQEQLVLLLGAKHQNICVVGDDDQGLYRFRGATIRNILEFQDHFKSCKMFVLNENYRSEKDIIDFYNAWMHDTHIDDKHNFDWDRYRFKKEITAAKSHFIEGQPTVLRVAGSDEPNTWMPNIVDFIKQLKASGKLKDYNQIAFLFKSVKSHNVIELAHHLEKNGIPVYSPRSDLFFLRQEIKLVIGALIFMFPKYVEKLTKSAYFISPDLVKYYLDCIATFRAYLKETEPGTLKLKNPDLIMWLKFRIQDHTNLNQNLDYALSGLMYKLFQFEPFRSYLDTNIASGITDTRAIRNLAKFSELISKYEYLHRINIFTINNIDYAVERFFNVYLRFMYDGGIGEYEDESEYAPSGCVSFMTIHQSKGLEFPIVIVGSLFGIPRNNNDEIISLMESSVYKRPPFEPQDKIKYFDFWRLYYTAFSRAQNLLVLTASNKQGRGADPSKYFENAFSKPIDYWDRSIDYSQYDFDEVKKSNIKQSYSFTSNIAAYEVCPTQYKFFNELGFVAARVGQTLFGTLVHHTIEDIHKAALRNESKTITAENVEKWFELNYDSICQKEHNYLQERAKTAALRQVQNYVESNNGEWSHIRAAEIDVSHIEPDYILTGTVDLISGKGDTVEVIDFKAEKKPDMELDKDRLARYKKQLEIYAYIIEHKLGLKVSRMHLYYSGSQNESPWVSFDYEKSAIDSAVKEFSGVVKKIQNKDFSSRCTNINICNNCDFRFYCGKSDK